MEYGGLTSDLIRNKFILDQMELQCSQGCRLVLPFNLNLTYYTFCDCSALHGTSNKPSNLNSLCSTPSW
jgi:hypothetical protein